MLNEMWLFTQVEKILQISRLIIIILVIILARIRQDKTIQ